MYSQEKVLPFGNGERKNIQVTRMFDSIAKTYDRINHYMSLGIDRYWRNRLISQLRTGKLQSLKAKERLAAQASMLAGGSAAGSEILDIATGTGDLAILAAKKLNPKSVTGIDISDGMLEIARSKAHALARKAESSEQRDLLDSIRFLHEDATQMSFADQSFDTIMTSFGIRNFENLDAALIEMHRVLKPGGILAMLELSEPVRSPFKQFFRIYSHSILPLIGRMIANNKGAYEYLTRSIEAFPQGEQMTKIVKKAGFAEVAFERLTFGICTLYIIRK